MFVLVKCIVGLQPVVPVFEFHIIASAIFCTRRNNKISRRVACIFFSFYPLVIPCQVIVFFIKNLPGCILQNIAAHPLMQGEFHGIVGAFPGDVCNV